MHYTVDKIERELVELLGDDGSVLVVPKGSLGFKVRENDVLLFDTTSRTFVQDRETAISRKASYKERLEGLFKRKN
ncbi:MAG: DUF3006 domain-containing protein [Clostridia bacterium]|nr:DUF3006 domain-containing protein [Clostridia bacterium]MBP5754483.1 DUF3006 domain-containing protein [Clostridia bacterium]